MLRCHCGASPAHSRRVQPQADKLGRCVSRGKNSRPPSPAGSFMLSCNMGCDKAQGAPLLICASNSTAVGFLFNPCASPHLSLPIRRVTHTTVHIHLYPRVRPYPCPPLSARVHLHQQKHVHAHAHERVVCHHMLHVFRCFLKFVRYVFIFVSSFLLSPHLYCTSTCCCFCLFRVFQFMLTVLACVVVMAVLNVSHFLHLSFFHHLSLFHSLSLPSCFFFR